MILKKSKTYLGLMIGFAVVAWLSAAQLLLEKIELWKNPNYVPSCSWNPLFSCQGPMESWQASVFILPNPVIGLIGFSFVILLGFTAFFVKFPKWYWGLFAGGITFAYLFIAWLITQSLYDIEALCVYCMIVWTCVIPMFWLTWAEFGKTYFADKKFFVHLNKLKYAVIVLNYFIVMLMIYLQFTDFFTFLINNSFG